ncbi:hypothetical protein C8R46DRAFT_1248765 [Mycena filopes]|nr:hypothetical protein C8R46DRAFT_1248765 [Mycena filopes]
MASRISRTESSSSSFFFHPQKVSSPIEIPGRQSHDSDHAPPPSTERTTSPELIFEMEPFSPLDPLLAASSTPYSPRLCTSSRARSSTTMDAEDQEQQQQPLLYPFPILSAAHFNSASVRRPAGPPSSFSLPPITHKAPARPRPRPRGRSLSPLRELNSSSPSTAPADPADPAHAIRAEPVHKIIGFAVAKSERKPKPAAAAAREKPKPAVPQQQPYYHHHHHHHRPAPPPHRRRSSSISLSPRRQSSSSLSRSPVSDDELVRSLDRELDGGGGAVDFTQYLLRRIDRQSRKPLQFQTFHQAMGVGRGVGVGVGVGMMSVSVR